ncbi:transcriptional regulator, AsnC family [Natronincola peptidivorans]|uniref:siroheme decarboxylase n=1 Tax=Natronincola peptidivorans TaxID=426128 RepID=A0A1I0BQY5_9FIRM|nr:AsnC family transcriptional regulator [Natronincola peptidivorans]SET09053.1 transcriptional regulator, AsnC family [Natronincola peptidivorans]
MDILDRRILTHIQKDFPIDSRPYKEIGDKLGISEQEVMDRVKHLKETGIIRRIGGVFDSRKLGYHSTLCALQVAEENLQETADRINAIPGVTHNYIRDHQYNMWFTLIGPSEEYLEKTLQDIKRESPVEKMLNLPAVDFFKINVQFNLESSKKEAAETSI